MPDEQSQKVGGSGVNLGKGKPAVCGIAAASIVVGTGLAVRPRRIAGPDGGDPGDPATPTRPGGVARDRPGGLGADGLTNRSGPAA
jgi:hypothetical protein